MLGAIAATVFAQPVTVSISGQVVNRFDPAIALGAGIDGHEHGEVARFLSPANVALMRSAGLQPLTYRLRTELAGEAWHWNSKGRWSDAGRQQGYWVSDDRPGEPIDVSYGYRLPRRGNTQDQANNDGYSRLDDGDLDSFWKSNPYLDGEPQWVAIDFQRLTPVNAIRVMWGLPAASEFVFQYSPDAGSDLPPDTRWQKLADVTTPVRWLRILMLKSTHTAPAESRDPRDAMGFAIREVEAGMMDSHGRLHDAIRHAANGKRQTLMIVSSTDCWHRAADLDPRVEQPGFDRVFQSGLTNGLPVLVPVPVLYENPEDAAAEIRYLKARGFAVNEVELGEEPEEQNIPPELYGNLFLRWSKALRAVDPGLKIGGPSLVLLQADQYPDPSWTKRLFSYLKNAVDFFSFEWYPFDEVCAPVEPQLLHGPEILKRALARLEADGLPRTVPRYITEYGYSAYSAEPEVDLSGALINADIVGTFLAQGGNRAYLYGYEPNELLNEKHCSWGNNMLFLQGSGEAQPMKLATFFGAQLLAKQWAQPGGGVHQMLATTTSDPQVGAFALLRPDGTWSVLLLNRSTNTAHTVHLDRGAGEGQLYQYSRDQYQWRAHKEKGRPVRNEPPVFTSVQVSAGVKLPPLSISVLRFR